MPDPATIDEIIPPIRVCPMGGDRTCPDDCPLAMWHGLSLKERKKKRKSFSQRLYQDGYTLEEIAVRLGFKKSTISNDLAEFSKNGKLKHDKTASNPKGAGRPKGKKSAPSPQTDKDRGVGKSRGAGAAREAGGII